MPRKNGKGRSQEDDLCQVQPLTSSIRSRWGSCKRAFHLMCEQNIQPRLTTTPIMRGSLVHIFLATWHTTKKPDVAWKAAECYYREHLRQCEQFYHGDELERMEKAFHLVKGMCRALPAYCKRHASKVIGIEHTMRARIRDLEGDFSVYAGTSDAILASSKGYWILDYKTRSRVHNSTSEWLSIDNQTIGYAWLLREEIKRGVFPKKPIKGVKWMAMMITGVRQKQNQTLEEYLDELEEIYVDKGEKFFRNISVPITAKKLDIFEEELYEDAQMIQATTARPKNTSTCLAIGRECGYLPLCTDGWTRRNKKLFEEKPPDYWEPKVTFDLEIDA